MWTVGSNPTLSVEYRGNPDPERRGRRSFRSTVVLGAVAQLGERQNRNLEVGGSIPLCSIREAGNDMN